MNEKIDLHAFADGQLTSEEQMLIKAQLKADPNLASEVDSIHNLKSFVANNACKLTCEDTWSMCVSRMNELDRVKKTESFVGRYAWALCGSFAVLIAVAGVFHKANAPTSVQNADFAKAMSGLYLRSTPVSPNKQATDKYLDDLLGQAAKTVNSDHMIVKDRATGFVDGHPITKLCVQDKIGLLCVVVIEDAVRIEGLEVSPEFPGYGLGKLGNGNCIKWDVSGRTIILAGERTYADLVTAAKALNR